MSDLRQEVHDLRLSLERLTREVEELRRERQPSPPTATVAVGTESPSLPDELPVDLTKAKSDPNGRFVSIVAYWRSGQGEMLTHTEEDWSGLADAPEGIVAQFLAPLGSEQRVALMKVMADGGLTSRELSERTGLSTGQLYHHLRELAAVGYLLTRERNSYELTARGKRVLLVGLALAQSLGRSPVEPSGRGRVVEAAGLEDEKTDARE
ncbi:MAG: winged helix-turn-helix domain-containing protein [Bacillota bacterium]